MVYLTGKSALMTFGKHPDIGSRLNRHFKARGYYMVTISSIAEEVIKKYIKEGQEAERKEEEQLDRLIRGCHSDGCDTALRACKYYKP